jgi:hypothetical protein
MPSTHQPSPVRTPLIGSTLSYSSRLSMSHPKGCGTPSQRPPSLLCNNKRPSVKEEHQLHERSSSFRLRSSPVRRPHHKWPCGSCQSKCSRSSQPINRRTGPLSTRRMPRPCCENRWISPRRPANAQPPPGREQRSLNPPGVLRPSLTIEPSLVLRR